MLSGAEEGAQGAPFESYKLAAVRLAEAVRGEYITYNSGSALWGNQRSAFA
jgi:hypothetical protein